jgi:thiosulfate/3-mercaptopyruvate sulfurtransferase
MSDAFSKPRGAIAACIAILLVLPLATGAFAAEGYFRPDLLVDAAWLQTYGDHPNVRIIDFGRSFEDYTAAHVPGAAFIDRAAITTSVGGIPVMLAHVERVAAALRDAGVHGHSTVVVYDASGGLWAARLFWAMEYLGHEDVRLLDGGWDGWVADDCEVSSSLPLHATGTFEPEVRPARLATRDWILDHLDDPRLVLLDVRTVDEYTGEDASAERGGHIPGAVNVNWVAAFRVDDAQKLLPPSELVDVYETVGVTPDMAVVTYCQGGVRAAHTYFVLRLLGFQDVRVYDASWAEWGNDPDAPVVAGDSAK